MFSGKRLLLFGFIIILLIGIPLSLYLVQQQQEVRSHAEKSTTLSLTPATTTKGVGDTIPLDVMIDPGKNLASFVKLEITYDPTKLSIDQQTGFVPNPSTFPITVEGPVFSSGKILVSLSIGANTTAAISTVSKVATITFKALETTSGSTTSVGMGPQTQVLASTGPQTGSNDQASEDVLSTTNPAAITITGATVTTITPNPSVTITTAPTVTLVPTATPTPTQTSSSSANTPNQPPACTALNLDRATNGTAPYSITFTAVGNDTDGTIGQASFNFGDGPVSNVTTGGGIGTNTVNTQIAHTYNNPGTYNAYVLLTDSSGAVSDFNTCKTTITVAGSSGEGGSGTTVASGGSTNTTPAPTLANTGPSTLVVGTGALVGMLSLIGMITFFFF
jgi:hypothetical protein